LAHLVAGTRSFDISMPKEINRLVIDALSDYLFTAGVRSNSVATREQQTEATQTFMVGNILMDSLRFCRDRLHRPSFDVEDGKYILLTLNRRVLLGDEEKLGALLRVLSLEHTNGMPVFAPLRGEARGAVERLLGQSGFESSAIQVVEPLSYLEFGWLSAHAAGVITDSGNVAEEATWNFVPCITLNSYTEHIETVKQGTNVLVGEDPARLAEELGRMVSHQWKDASLPDRWDGRSAERIVQVLM
jgi:UDP-N-acetylglucosamine 2-epimerase (non-hydrolysing)